MISKKNELKRFLKIERELYIPDCSLRRIIKCRIIHNHDYEIWRFQKALRYFEFHLNNKNKVRSTYWQIIKNNRQVKLGFAIPPNTIGYGLHIWHYGNIIINGYAKIGRNCQFHGMNCIGNKGVASTEAPTIGENVDIGVGAVIIGNITIADGCQIGANAVVTKSCFEKNAILIGAPARIVGYKK